MYFRWESVISGLEWKSSSKFCQEESVDVMEHVSATQVPPPMRCHQQTSSCRPSVDLLSCWEAISWKSLFLCRPAKTGTQEGGGVIEVHKSICAAPLHHTLSDRREYRCEITQAKDPLEVAGPLPQPLSIFSDLESHHRHFRFFILLMLSDRVRPTRVFRRLGQTCLLKPAPPNSIMPRTTPTFNMRSHS